jgi:hypothetical protein
MVANPGKNAVYGMKNRAYRVSRGGMRPTSASCIITDEYGDKKLVGKCHRAEWFRLNGVAATNPPNDRSYGIFATGNGMEDYFQEIWKDQGILMAGNVVNYGAIDTHPDVVISGESDIIVWDHDIDAEGRITAIHRDRAIGIEMKTCRGHFAKKEVFGIGNKMYPMGKPKMEHIMQAAMYLMMREKHEKHYGVTIDHYLIFYFAVDTGEYTQFKITLSNGYDGEVIVETMDGKPVEPDVAYQLIAGKTLNAWSDLTTDNIMARYEELLKKLKDANPPDRDYQLRYDEATVKKLMDKDGLSKTKYNQWLKNPMAEVGDWQCSYCDFKSHCYPVSVFTLDVEDGVLTLDEAMRELGYEN